MENSRKYFISSRNSAWYESDLEKRKKTVNCDIGILFSNRSLCGPRLSPLLLISFQTRSIDEVHAPNDFQKFEKAYSKGKHAYFRNALICNFETYWARYSLSGVFRHKGITYKRLYLYSVLRNTAS
jgi:hypothetical protein